MSRTSCNRRPVSTAERRALLEEDLRSPCTEELAVFQAFSNLLRRGRDEYVVVDTAPTGHTLMLLDRTGAYRRDVMRTSTGIQGRITTPLMRLRDAALYAGADRNAGRDDAGPRSRCAPS